MFYASVPDWQLWFFDGSWNSSKGKKLEDRGHHSTPRSWKNLKTTTRTVIESLALEFDTWHCDSKGGQDSPSKICDNMLQDNVYNIYVCIHYFNQFHFHMIAPPIPTMNHKNVFFFNEGFPDFFSQPTNPCFLQNLGSKRRSTGLAFRRQKHDVSDPIVVTGWDGWGLVKKICPKKKTHTHTPFVDVFLKPGP